MMGGVREASTLILIAGSGVAHQPPIVLTIQRGSNLNYLPDARVFPGGNFDVADGQVDWLSIIPRHEQNFKFRTVISEVTQVPIAISSRITAIRETFEECGILLCKPYGFSSLCSGYRRVVPLRINDDRGWRDKIQKNPKEFLNLCRSYRCYPDVRGLYLFSNWVTPFHVTRRYDCKFFVAIMDRVVDGEIHAVEVQSMEWKPISYYIKEEFVFLPPPQLHELSNLERLKDIDSLNQFVFEIDQEECETLTSIYVGTTDGYVFLLPGDEKYDQFQAKNVTDVKWDGDILSFRSGTMRRLEYPFSHSSSLRRNLVIQNYSPKHSWKNINSIRAKL